MAKRWIREQVPNDDYNIMKKILLLDVEYLCLKLETLHCFYFHHYHISDLKYVSIVEHQADAIQE